MKVRPITLTADRLRQLLDYDPATGIFKWLVARGGGAKPGNPAGYVHHLGYRWIIVDGRSYAAGRLAWLHVHGAWPAETIDHINRQKDDNRIANLREATPAQNSSNRSRKPGKYGRGVSFSRRRNKYLAYVSVKGRKIYCGTFDTPEQAHAKYVEEASQLYGSFFHEGAA